MFDFRDKNSSIFPSCVWQPIKKLYITFQIGQLLLSFKCLAGRCRKQWQLVAMNGVSQ